MHKKTTLDNGLRIITNAMPHTRSVSICIYIGVGSRYEAETVAGISHFIEHLCFKGTSKRVSPKDIAVAIEGVGGILNASTSKELTSYWCRVAQPHFSLALDVLVDILLNSRFDPVDVERERQVIIEEINMSKDSPQQQVGMLIDKLLWPDHPLGRDVAGSKKSVTAITREMIFDFMADHYLPANMVVAVAGDIKHGEVINGVSQALGAWTNQKPGSGYLPYQEEPNPRLKIENRDTEQTHLCLALPGLPLLHPARFVLSLLNTILGEGMSSRLFLEVRDRLGLAYSVYSYIEHYNDSGAMTVYAGVEHNKLEVAVNAILEQLSQLRESIPEEELSKVKELLKGRLLLRMEDSRSVAGWAGGQEILTGRILTVDRVVSIVDAITAQEVQQLARELLTGDRLRLAVVGPVKNGERLEELLKL